MSQPAVATPAKSNGQDEHAPASDPASASAASAASATSPTDGGNTTTVHPLHCKWTLFYNGPAKDKSSNWKDNVKQVMTVGSVEDFWGLYQNIPKVDELAGGSDYNLFREGIFPGWEDDANREGGKFLLMVNGGDTQQLTTLWLDSCLFAVGEQFEDTNEICGIVVSVRPRGHKLCLWTRTASNVEKTRALGMAWKEALGLRADQKIKYQFHSESLQSQRSFPKGDAFSL